jgi:hypothetical protein
MNLSPTRRWSSLIILASTLIVSPVSAQDAPSAIKVLRLEKLDLAPGIITHPVAQRFHAFPEEVESRLKGSVLATLSQELTSSKLLRLAVRDQSLARLQREAKTTEELGNGTNPDANSIGVDEASLLAYAKIEDFVADYRTMSNSAGAAARWKLRITISMEIVERKTGTKKVIKEDFEETGNGVVSSARIGAPNFDSGQVRALADGVAKKLGVRLLDLISPPRIIQARGKMFIVDRGRAAGMKEGQIVEVIEPVEDNLDTDASFPIGKARVKSVKEETSILELISLESLDQPAEVEIKKHYSISRPVSANTPSGEPKATPPNQKRR